ncbi:hypothetical protein F4809DRAFT_603149 [Biscogniauxia mediterranea]|nr:hypothetical protein F4809DRAFT_603149 [Biscogniauxia mediterranea]
MIKVVTNHDVMDLETRLRFRWTDGTKSKARSVPPPPLPGEDEHPFSKNRVYNKFPSMCYDPARGVTYIIIELGYNDQSVIVRNLLA